MAEAFSPEEQELLRPFVTNLDRDIFCLRNLPEVVKGALFARYSRSDRSLRRLLLEEFILKPEVGLKEMAGESGREGVALKRAEEFYERVLVGFGDDSVAELGGAHVACENVSNILSKVLEDARIGISPLEKSTRYVFFDRKEGGRYRYYREPAIMASRHAEIYEETCDFLFDTYARLIGPVSKWVEEKNPREEGVSERAYAASVRARTCDLLRGLLPASTLTNVGLYGNGRAFEYLLTKMFASELAEAREAARQMKEELDKVIPSFVKRSVGPHGLEMQEFIRGAREAMGEVAGAGKGAEMRAIGEVAGAGGGREVELVDFDERAEEKIVAAALFPHSNASMSELMEKARRMSAGERAAVLDAYCWKRKNRRHKPGRAFEHACYTFSLLGNYGMYRDLHRHRMLTQERQLLGCAHGYDMPGAIAEAGFGREFREAMERAKEAWEAIAADMPVQAQYVVPLAYRIRWYMRLNLRELYHLIELRSSAQGHEDYRRMALMMLGEVERVHPRLVAHMEFVDRKMYGLGRLEAEKRSERKRRELEGSEPP